MTTVPCLAVTAGEPAGIATELIAHAWQQRKKFNTPCFFVIAQAAQFEQLKKEIALSPIDQPEEAIKIFDNALPCLAPRADFHPVEAGSPQSGNVPYVIESIERACSFALQGRVSAIVTPPIHKAILKRGGFSFPGHTEFLASLSGRKNVPVMLLKGPSLSTVPLTLHHGLKEACALLTQDLIFDKTHIVYRALKDDFAIANPRIAICGLNPHAGEEGTFGDEEQRIITPAIKKLQQSGLPVTGPHSADSLFSPRSRTLYDVALCMYHDQALIPVKTLDFDRTVNVTLNLPFIRTSPDHGTAFDIAGKDIARPDSFLEALKLGKKLGKNRLRTKKPAHE